MPSWIDAETAVDQPVLLVDPRLCTAPSGQIYISLSSYSELHPLLAPQSNGDDKSEALHALRPHQEPAGLQRLWDTNSTDSGSCFVYVHQVKSAHQATVSFLRPPAAETQPTTGSPFSPSLLSLSGAVCGTLQPHSVYWLPVAAALLEFAFEQATVQLAYPVVLSSVLAAQAAGATPTTTTASLSPMDSQCRETNNSKQLVTFPPFSSPTARRIHVDQPTLRRCYSHCPPLSSQLLASVERGELHTTISLFCRVLGSDSQGDASSGSALPEFVCLRIGEPQQSLVRWLTNNSTEWSADAECKVTLRVRRRQLSLLSADPALLQNCMLLLHQVRANLSADGSYVVRLLQDSRVFLLNTWTLPGDKMSSVHHQPSSNPCLLEMFSRPFLPIQKPRQLVFFLQYAKLKMFPRCTQCRRPLSVSGGAPQQCGICTIATSSPDLHIELQLRMDDHTALATAFLEGEDAWRALQLRQEQQVEAREEVFARGGFYYFRGELRRQDDTILRTLTPLQMCVLRGIERLLGATLCAQVSVLHQRQAQPSKQTLKIGNRQRTTMQLPARLVQLQHLSLMGSCNPKAYQLLEMLRRVTASL